MYIWATGIGPMATDYHYPDPDLALFDDERITKRDDPNYKANGIYFIRNDQGADKQLEHFVPDPPQLPNIFSPLPITLLITCN